MNLRTCFILALLSFIGVFGLSIRIFLFTPKVAYVNSEELISHYEGMIDARAIYQQKAAIWKANVDTLEDEVQELIISCQAGRAKISSREKERKQDLISIKQKQLIEYQQAMGERARQEDARMTGEVINQINTYLKRYGEENGYKIVMAVTEFGNIAYADEALDITGEVLAGLNKEYKGK